MPEHDDPTQYDPSKVYWAFTQVGEDWADANAAAELLERTREVLLAQLKTEAGDMTDAAATRIALARPEYTEHVTKMVEARRNANRLKARLNALEALADARRTAEATRRKEVNML